MKRLLALLGALALFATCDAAAAQSGPPQPSPASVLAGYTTLSVTNASARVAYTAAISPFNAITIYNYGTKDAFYAQGDVTCTALTTSIRVPAGTEVTPVWASGTYICAITGGSDTTTLAIYQGNGPIYLLGVSVASSGGGAITGNVGILDSSAARIDPSTAGNQTATQANAGSDATKAIAIQGITSGKAVPVSAASLPLPANAATETGGNLASLVTDVGPPGATACATDTGSCALNALLQRLAQRITSLITATGTPFQASGSVGNTSFANNDGTNTQKVTAASTSAALADKAGVVALSPNPSPICTSSVALNQTASTDLATMTNTGFICQILLISATAQNVSVVEGTGTVCATSKVALIGGTTASIALAANAGFSAPFGLSPLKMKSAADHLCLLQDGSGNISGIVTYQDHS